MAYHVHIIRVQPPGPGSDAGVPSTVSPNAFETIQDAVEHAEGSLPRNGNAPATHTYDIVDENGNSVLHQIGRKR